MPRSPAPTAMASTPAPVPPMRARSDDQEPQPTPKKLKSELLVGDKPPRRAALRDVTNELRTHGESHEASAKKQLCNVVKKPRTVVVGADGEEAKPSPPQDPSHDELEIDEPSEGELDEEVTHSASEPVVLCALEEELLAFDPLMGQEDEDELSTILYERLREKQERYRVAKNYFEEQLQPHLNAKMRSILVDWLIDVHYRLKLHPETLFLAINYLDRYLTEALTTRSELQLVGLTCLFIASKFEEVEPADLSDLSYATDKTYTSEQIIAMERKIIDVLSFNLSATTAHAFVDYFTQKFQSDRAVSLLAAFFTQSTLLHLPLVVCYPPAVRAAAAVFLAQCVASGERPDNEWVLRWESVVMTCFEDMLPCLHDVCTIVAHPSKKLVALRTKFGTKRFGRVANKPMDNLERFL